jgi:hypothetical protein
MFFKKKKEAAEVSKTGIYTLSGKKLTPLTEVPKTGSINDIAESLDYHSFHCVLTFQSEKTDSIAFKRRTKEPIFVIAKSKDIALAYSDIANEISKIDWAFENRQLDFEDSKTVKQLCEKNLVNG